MGKKSKKKKKNNTHNLLKKYRPLSNYPQIAQATAAWAKANPQATEAETLQWVEETFRPPTLPTMRDEPVAWQLFGEVETHIPANAVGQMDKVMRLPMATRGAMMPDAHLGYAMPIGGVAALENAISPSFVGYDISCMVQLTILDITPDDFEADRHHLADALKQVTAFGIGSDFARGEREHDVMSNPTWAEVPIAQRLKSLAQKQLGSSGGGNHFADLVIVEPLAEWAAFTPDQRLVGLLTHSGSRGTGHKIATHYVKRAEQYIAHAAQGILKGYEWLPVDHEWGAEYIAAMTLMGHYAKANHDLIHDHFCQAAGLMQLRREWNRHNFAWFEGDEVIHRKGATPAENGRIGLIPGTSGTASYVVRGLGNDDSINSSSHGAGRWFSRSEARRRHDKKAFRKHMQNKDILHFGLEADETFMAYKDIEMVIDLQDGTLIEPIARMTPRVVLMGGRSDDGD